MAKTKVSFKKKEIRNIIEYVEYIKKHCKADDILFRGQNVDKPLVPRIARMRLRKSVEEAEKAMLEDFQLRVVPLLQVQPESAWDWLALAQHHGMATRLLDWMKSPLGALWFAVRRPPVKHQETGAPRAGVVWVLTPKKWNYVIDTNSQSPFEIKTTKIFRPRHVTPRLAAQAGCFSAHPFVRSKKRFVPLERNSRYSKQLTKLRIPPECFQPMRFQLDRYNVNAASLFPDIDGLCEHIQWLNSELDDEK